MTININCTALLLCYSSKFNSKFHFYDWIPWLCPYFQQCRNHTPRIDQHMIWGPRA